MPLPDQAALFAASEATWPPASRRAVGPFTIREGRGGGSRVSAATAEGPADEADIAAAEAAMIELGQVPLVMVREGEQALDVDLAARDYRVKDPVVVHAAPITTLATERPPPATTFEAWPPLAIQTEIWAAGGIGPARLAVMARAAGPKTTLLGRDRDRPAATAYVAVHGAIAVLHALEVVERFRRRGIGRDMVHAAAFWARDQGATTLVVLVTRANEAANPLYAGLGMTPAAGYHYRIREAR